MRAGSSPGFEEPQNSQQGRQADSTDHSSFDRVLLRDFLDSDDRPTFVLARQASQWVLVYINEALRNVATLVSALETDRRIGSEPLALTDLLATLAIDRHSSEHSWQGQRWRKTSVTERWLVFQTLGHVTSENGVQSAAAAVQGSAINSERPPVRPTKDSMSQETLVDEDKKHPKDAAKPRTDLEDSPVIDWTRPSVPAPTSYTQFFKDFDWSATSLGPIESWPPQLRTVCNTILADEEPTILLWGPSLTMLYNQGCVDLIGQKHPSALGHHPADVFGELWEPISGLVDNARRTGQPSKQQNMYLPLNRKGWLEETYWTFTMLPIIGPDGTAAGVYDRFVESTGKVLVERRMTTLVKIGDLASSSNDLKMFWKHLLEAIELNVEDHPFAAVYSATNVEDMEQSSASSMSSSTMASKQCLLEAHVGVLPEQNNLPTAMFLSEQSTALTDHLLQAWKTDKPVFLQHRDGSLPSYLQLRNPDRSFGDVCRSAVIFPIRFTLEHMLVGFLILGSNPRRPVDEDYTGYLSLLHRRIVDAGASVFVPAEEHRNRAIQREEALRQANLASTLLSRTHAAELKQNRFMRLAERAPIGMGLYDSNSNPIFFNDAYFEMTGLTRGEISDFGWLDYVHADDVEYVMGEWKKLSEERIPVTLQHRVKKPWRSINKADGTETVGETWLLVSAFPELTGDGLDAGPSLIMGWTIDISHQKWAESIIKQRLEEALESKRQTENFIDMTSHEMRNPLSAILQSADGISTLIASHTADSSGSNVQELLQLIQDNAQTVILCAQHQKRIVDDILTLSKLDSNLLLITPDKVDPVALASHCLKMYEAELASNHISYGLEVEEGFKALNLSVVLVDPSRLLQVLINLLTNAIKFTQLETRRDIRISIDASMIAPAQGHGGVAFVPVNRSRRKSPTTSSLHAQGEPVYITFSVHDSGRGLSDDERKLLFQRFSQASPRTHVQYGGSGLGLFISRELTEIQGGQIGVVSKLGKGSTFSFYVKTWRCTPGENGNTGSGVGGVGEAVAMPFTSQPITQKSSRGQQLKAAYGIKVLVVEDNIINQKVMANQLKGMGCTVYVANHGGEALDILGKSTFSCTDGASTTRSDPPRTLIELDVVLMDVEMPVMDGLTCVRKIRELQDAKEFLRHVPVICITANAREAQIAEAKAEGCDLVVTKPFRIPELMPQMQQLISEHENCLERA